MSAEQPQHSLWLGPPQPNLRVVIEEFARLLEVLNAQLEHAMQDAGRDSAALGLTFQHIASANARIAALGSAPCGEIARHCADIDARVNEAVTALQFQDRLAQRAVHVRTGLDYLRKSLRDPRERPFEEWLELLRDIEVIQEMEQSKLMDAASGGSAELF